MPFRGSIHPREFDKFFEDARGETAVRVSDGSNLSSRIDATSTAGVVYIGSAEIGSATSDAVWQILKYDIGSEIVLSYADTDDLFDNIWDNRTALSYG